MVVEYPYNRPPLRPVRGDEYDSASQRDDFSEELTTNGQEHERYRDPDEPVARNRELLPAETRWTNERSANDG